MRKLYYILALCCVLICGCFTTYNHQFHTGDKVKIKGQDKIWVVGGVYTFTSDVEIWSDNYYRNAIPEQILEKVE